MHSSRDQVHHFILVQFVLSWLGGLLLENGLVWHASEIVAGENGLVKFCDAILASRTLGCMRKLLCYVRSSPHGLRCVSMYKTTAERRFED